MTLQSLTDRQGIRKQLIAAGLKATHQRIVILETVIALHDKHPTAEGIHQYLTEANPGISLGTVYKTLDHLVEADLLKRVFSDNNRRYDLNGQAHSHIYCTNTHEIIDFADPELEKLMTAFFSNKNFKNFSIRDISVQIVGTKIDPAENIIIT